MALPDLPVWTIRPNWKEGILERLEWLTDVLISETGVEQRRSPRPTPRRSFEITVNPTSAERTRLDLLLHRWGSRQWLFPLWHDQAKLDAEAHDALLHFDNRWREFDVGGYAIVYQDYKTYEIVEITAQDENGLTLADPIVRNWPAGTKVYPLRICTLPADTSLDALTGTVGEAVLLFTTNQANPYDAGLGDDMVLYNGSPLLTRQPDRSQNITLNHVRMVDEFDSGTGLRYRTDSAGRAFEVQSHNWQIMGREAHASFRSFLYTMNGRQNRVYLPSFNDDLVLSRPHGEFINYIDVRSVGLAEIGGGSPIPGRATLWTGDQVIRHVNFGEYYDGTTFDQEERLVIQGDLDALPAGATLQFLSTARLDTDQVELHHHTDSDGVMECGVTFRTFLDVRDDSGSNFLPIPAAAQTAGSCGTPVGVNPCRQVSLVCGFDTYLAVQTPITRMCPGSVGHPEFMYLGFPHPLLPDVTLYQYGEPLQQTVYAQAGNPLNIPAGTLMLEVNGLNVNIHVPLYIGNRDGSFKRYFYLYGEWPNRPDNTNMCEFDFASGTFKPEESWVSGAVPDPNLNCAMIPTPFFKLRYISYASHSWTFNYNQTVYEDQKWEDY